MDDPCACGLPSFYEAFPPQEAYRLAQQLEIHCTSKHGSWLNMAEIDMAEIENSAMARQCLSRRIPEKQVMEEEMSARSK